MGKILDKEGMKTLIDRIVEDRDEKVLELVSEND